MSGSLTPVPPPRDSVARKAAKPPEASVATRARGAYLAPVSLRRILSLLLLVSLALAPLSMIGGSAAMATGGQAMTGMSHEQDATGTPPCHGNQQQSDDDATDTKQLPGNCCVMMCVAIPAVGGQLAEQLLQAQIRQPLPPARGPHGLEPEAEPPPPRLS